MGDLMTNVHLRATLGALGAAVLLAACSLNSATDRPPDHGPLRPPAGSGPYVYPDIAYTGCDGVSSMLVPLATNLQGVVTWTVSDINLASVAPASAPQTYAEFGENWALVETFKAGTVTVTATDASGQSVTSTIVISKYEPAVVQAGRQRYYEPTNPGGARKACNTCHGGIQGTDHSPLELEFFQDDEILHAITEGAYPSGYVLQTVDHRWNLTAEEAAGIVPFLRSLHPTDVY
jgi:hypothetical protein